MRYVATSPDGQEIEIAGTHRTNMSKYPPRYVIFTWNVDHWGTLRWTSSLQRAVQTTRGHAEKRTFIALVREVADE